MRFWAIATLLCAGVHATERDATIELALQRMYDFNFPASHEVLTRYIAQHPQDPLPYAFRGSAYLFYELDRMHILESDFFIDDDRIKDTKKKAEPDPAVRAKFLEAIHDAENRAAAALKANPNDKQALFAMCIAQGVSTDYMAFVEKRQISSISVAKKANGYAQRLMKLDPKFYDAYLTAGISEYMIGSLPFFIRWFVKFENIDGDKKKGVERLEMVAREGHYFGPFSKILLATIALREKRPRDAQRILQDLSRDYPANPLFRRELDKISAKIGVAAN